MNISSISKISRKIKNFVFFCSNSIRDRRLNSTIFVKESGKIIFKLYDYGPITRMRASSFEKKEPETIKWIKGFDIEDKLLDIGSNIGLYSLYAALKGINVVSVEPDALNYALLNLNIRLNNFGHKILPFCIAIHNESKFSKFNISSSKWGGALNSFDNNFDFKGNEFKPIHSQGTYGISLDLFLKNISFTPNHLKIDVDGNENLILIGSKEFLKNSSLKSILIELDETRKDYFESIDILKKSGFKLQDKTYSEIYKKSKISSVYNHIFVR